MITGGAIIYGILLPALIAFVLLLLGGRGTPLSNRPLPFLGALAIGAGYLLAHFRIAGPPRSPLGDSIVPGSDWIAWLVLGAIVLAPLRMSPKLARWSGPLYMALFSVLVMKLVLGGFVDAGSGGVFIRLGLTFALYVTWNLTERLALRSSGPAVPIALLVAGSGIAASALLVNIAVLAQLTGAVCAALGAAALLAIIQKDQRLPTGAVAIVMIVFAGVLVQTSIYDLPPASAVLLVAAVLAPWITELGQLSKASATRRALIAAAAAAVPAAIAVAIANAAAEATG